MSFYLVTIERTEEITFRVEADSPDEAEDNALMDGEEVLSKTTGASTVSVELEDA